ncbi:MAG TPA: hypothetical protein VGH98_18975 [Gemmatimonadaceae bacterium]
MTIRLIGRVQPGKGDASNLANEHDWLWTPTTAARDRPDPWVIEIIAAVNLRATYGLVDGASLEVASLGVAPRPRSPSAPPADVADPAR